METIQCRNCRKDRRVTPTSRQLKLCIRCSLITNKLLLHKCYTSITTQLDMLEFNKEMEGWYPTP